MIKKHCVSKKHLIYKRQLLNPSTAAKLFNQLSWLNRSCKYQAYSKWAPLPYATWYFAHCCPIFPKSFQLFLTDALWRNTYLTYWVRSGQKATPTASPLDFPLFFFLPCISVVRCCYESKIMKITSRDVRFLGKRINTKTQTFLWQSRASRPSSSIGGEGCCIPMLKCFYTCS